MKSLYQDKNYHVCVLLAVWGETFINDFLQLSLPSLLAPGNLPAIAKAYKTRFVFLTRSSDIHVFESHPAYQKLKVVCEIEFLSIEDLIVFGNYSTTLTLAYDLAIQQTGEAMLNTYFIFLTSDYIMADGSLEGLMRYMQKGYSGICAGNFQVIKEEVEPYLLSQIDPKTRAMPIKPRELLQHSLPHLHPIAIASIIDQNIIHNYHANRFFLRHDNSTTVGRFYLLHMLCIKPEVTNYKIGASCDYSFIPEMCPSGNVAVITDSDDYLVVEIQSKSHELNFVNWGKYDIKKLAHALSEWTTKEHRENVRHSIYFHANTLSENDKIAIEGKLNQFVDSISENLNKNKMHPHRNHPYWVGAIKSFDKQRDLLKNKNDYDFLDLTILTNASLKKLFYRVFGKPPQVYPWHHRFGEYCTLMNEVKALVTEENRDKTIVLYDSYLAEFMRYCGWLKDTLKIPHHYHVKNLLTAKDKLAELKAMQFERCLLLVRVEDLDKIKPLLTLTRELIKKDGKSLVLIPNELNHYSKMVYDFQGEFSQKINALVSSPYQITKVQTIQNNLTVLGTMLINRINRLFAYSQRKRFISYILLGIPGVLFNSVWNMLSRFIYAKNGHCTHILVTLVPQQEESGDGRAE